MVRPSRLNGGGIVPFVIGSDCPRPSRLFLLAISIGYRHLSSLIIPFASRFYWGMKNYKKVQFIDLKLFFDEIWRRGWDSNPRYSRLHAGFQDRCLKPLGHPSKKDAQVFTRFWLKVNHLFEFF